MDMRIQRDIRTQKILRYGHWVYFLYLVLVGFSVFVCCDGTAIGRGLSLEAVLFDAMASVSFVSPLLFVSVV
jgi:hypothetical protein